jgi:hypothetical protein
MHFKGSEVRERELDHQCGGDGSQEEGHWGGEARGGGREGRERRAYLETSEDVNG